MYHSFASRAARTALRPRDSRPVKSARIICMLKAFFRLAYSFFWPFSTSFNKHNEERTGKQGQRQKTCGKGRRFDSNPGGLLSALWHVIACSMHWAKLAPRAWIDLFIFFWLFGTFWCFFRTSNLTNQMLHLATSLLWLKTQISTEYLMMWK